MKKIMAGCMTLALVLASYGQGNGTNITITSQPQSQIVPVGANATFSVTVTGAGPFGYQWQFDGTNLFLSATNSIITTVAGGGSGGDGGPATNAGLARPFDAIYDAFGNLLVADQWGERVRKVNSSGIISTFAGNGSQSYSGDGGPATNAALNWPSSLALDGSGNLLIADGLNNRIRMVGTNGIITTVAGNGSGGFSGDGGAATNASLNYPQAVAVDSLGNIFIAEYNNNRVRVVGTNGIINTFAGGGSGGLGDGGPATNATLSGPHGLAVDSSGNVFISDLLNNRVRRVGINGVITTFAGNGTAAFSGDGGPATNASLNNPCGLTLDSSGNLFIADYVNDRVRIVTPAGIIATVAGKSGGGFSGDGGPATNALLNQPVGVHLDPSGDLFIADASNARIRKVVLPAGSSGGPVLTLNFVTTNNAGNYTVIVTNSSQSVTSSIAVLQVNSIILVNGKLAGGTVPSISSAQISFNNLFPNGFLFYTLDGTTPTTGSQIYFGPITLTNSAIVQVLNVNSNDTQSVLSPQVTVDIGTAPAITMSPTNEILAVGAELNLAASASGSPPLSYQWWKSSGIITGATNSNYDVAAVGLSDAGTYYAGVSNLYGTATSTAATVTVYAPVNITQPPTNQVARLGGTASFSVSATAYPAPTYQWIFDDTNMPGATSNVLTISNVQLTNLGSYSVLVSNAYSSQVTTPATLSMIPAIVTPYVGATAIWGQSAVLSVGAIGTAPLSYQWYQNGAAIDGATDSVFDLSSVQFTNGGLYTVVVSSPLGSVTNTPALLVVNPAGTSIGMYAGITINGTAGYSYAIQYTTDLQSTNSWVTLTNLTLEQPVELWVDTSTNALTTPHRFYQILPGQ